MPYVYGYVRVSDEKQLGGLSIVDGQEVDNSSLANQKQIVIEWWETSGKKRFPDHEFRGFFEDPAQSASKIPLPQRENGKHMMATVRKDDIIVAADSKRVFREPLDYYMTKAILKPRGVNFLFVNQPDVDYNTPEGELIAMFMFGLGNYESQTLGRRISAAHRARMKSGRVTGPWIPPGWKKRYRILKGETKRTIYYEPCERERQILRMFQHMSTVERHLWTQDKFRLFVYKNNLRRGENNEGGYWKWEFFTTSDMVVKSDFLKANVRDSRRGYDREFVSAEVVPVRRRSENASRPKRQRASGNPLELLWQSPAGTRAGTILRQLNQGPTQPEPAAEALLPYVSPSQCSSGSDASQTHEHPQSSSTTPEDCRTAPVR